MPRGPAGPESGAPVTLLPAITARPLLFATVSIGSLDRLLASGVRLAGEAVPLPMTAEGVRDMLLSQAGLPPEVASELDLRSPAAAAVVALDDKGGSGVVLAIPTRGPAEAEKLIDALGARVLTRGPVTLIKSPSRTEGWVFRTGGVVVLGDQLDAVTRGAMLALEARRAAADDVTAVIYPDAIAHAHGTDVKSAIAAVIEQGRALQAENDGAVVTDRYVFETMTRLLGLVGDADRVELGLGIDPAQGLTLRARLVARPGTSLQAIASDGKGFQIDPIVLGPSQQRFVVGAMSVGAFWREMLDHYRQRLADDKSKGAPAALAYYQAFLAGMAGQQSGAVWTQKQAPYVSGIFSTPLKDAASAAKVGAALARMDGNAMSALMRAQLGSEAKARFDWSTKRESVGKVSAMHVRMTLKPGTARGLPAWERMFGGGIDLYQGVAGARMIITFGRDARKQLAAAAAANPAKPESTGPFVEAAAGSRGRDAFYYCDLAPVLGLVGVLSSNERASALGRMGSGPIPIVVTAGGDGVGKVWSTDLTLPVAAFRSVGGLLAAGMGAFK